MGCVLDRAPEAMQLAAFEPMLRRVFAGPKNSIYRAAVK
jgi:hypothetical protein